MEQDPNAKCRKTQTLWQLWRGDQLSVNVDHTARSIEIPGRPAAPELVAPRYVKKRGIAKQSGRNNLMHAIAHIEFNAINLALDAAYRFSGQPRQFYTDWLSVAADEARHFGMVCDYLKKQQVCYGDFPAHNGLWDMCVQTADDIVARMALVPRVMEARGLDVTPTLIGKLQHAGDHDAAAILEVIYQEEIRHVRIGSHWFRHHCVIRDLSPEETFLKCIDQYLHGQLRGPFNVPARREAGFEETELINLVNQYS